jgi:cleavage stimulation factor subunit 3
MRFIKNTPEGATSNAYEEQQKMDLLRKAYHRAVQIPLENVEQLWSELEAFEIGLNRTIAKKHMSDLMPGYMQARQVLRNLQRQTAPLNVPTPSKSVIPGLYLPARPSFTQAERNLVNAWKAYLKYEESNPLEMDDKEKAQLHARIQAQYRKACVQMRFFPEIWYVFVLSLGYERSAVPRYMFYMWHRSIGQDAEAEKVLKAGLEPNPTSFVLNYAQAEALEVQKKFSEVHDTYKRFIELLEPELEEVESRTSSANTSLNLDGSMIIGNNSSVNVSSVSGMADHTQASQMSSQGGNEGSTKSKEFIERRKEYGVVWIDYMRFARRAEGLQAARDVFKNARKSKWTPWEVYEASGEILPFLIQYIS